MFRYRKGVIDFDTKVPDRAFDLRMAQQKLHRPQVSGTTVDKGSVCSSMRVRTEEAGIQPDAGNPFGDEPSILPRCKAPTWTTPAGEQEFPWFLSGGPSGAIRRPPCHIVGMAKTKNYRVVLQKDGTYAVEVDERGVLPIVVGSFRTEAEAEAWIVKTRQMAERHH